MTPILAHTDLTIDLIRCPQELDRWHLVHAYLQLRTDVFVDQMSWNLHVHEGLEFEQYDTFAAVYVVAHRAGAVVGGARLIRTDHRNGVYSYMIRDASAGILEGLPDDLCREPAPTDSATWELTRFLALPDSASATAILTAANAFLVRESAKRCLFLGPPAFLRMAKSMGFTPRALGPISGNRDGRFLAFECPVL